MNTAHTYFIPTPKSYDRVYLKPLCLMHIITNVIFISFLLSNPLIWRLECDRSESSILLDVDCVNWIPRKVTHEKKKWNVRREQIAIPTYLEWVLTGNWHRFARMHLFNVYHRRRQNYFFPTNDSRQSLRKQKCNQIPLAIETLLPMAAKRKQKNRVECVGSGLMVSEWYTDSLM